MRAVLVVNPRATGTTAAMRDVLAHALAAELKLEVVTTEFRGHALAVARDAAADGVDLVVAHGGDGTLNEVTNGLLADGLRPDLPALGIVPGGCTNVLARTLGLPVDPVDATAVLLAALRAGTTRRIGLGQADDRYFTFCAGLGIDAATVQRVEGHRNEMGRVTPWRYARAALREYVFHLSHRHPTLALSAPGRPETEVFLGLVCNSSPWSYLGDRPVDPCPDASFESGLDVFALTRMRALPTLRVLGQLFRGGPSGRQVVSWHDLDELTLSSATAQALQVDGDYVGETRSVRLRAVPGALRVVVPAGLYQGRVS